MLVKQLDLTNHFKKLSLNPPSNKNEDWLNYNLEKLMATPLGENNHTMDITQYLVGNYFHFKNGKLEKKQLSDTIKTKTKYDDSTSSDSFIDFAKKTSQKEIIHCQNAKEKITIIYESTQGLSATNIECHFENSEITLERVFINACENVINNHLAIRLNQQSTVIMNEINCKNPGHILDFVDATLDNDCHFLSLNQTYLSTNSRFQNKVYLNGEAATARLNGLSLNLENTDSFYNTHVFHNVGDNESHQLFKSINKSAACFEYNGKVTVKKDAQRINSYQLNQNIILDDHAIIHSRPQLFIDADDVKCSHGSTTGDLNKDELFYLMSRGLDELTSKKMVLAAFIEDVFQEKEFKHLKHNVTNALDAIT